MSETATPVTGAGKTRKELDRAVIRFAGDSGDGMQLTGEQFTTESAWAGNDLATLPNFPAEIRAPAGTLFGVSSFQLQFGSQRVYTPGDRLDCLVAMNPAALVTNLRDREFVQESLALGQVGFVVKSRLVADLLPAARSVLAGQSFVSNSVIH